MLRFALSFLPLMFLASFASARPARIGQIPNAPASCNTCHTNGGGTPRNEFGQDVEDTLIGGANANGTVDWAAVCGLDSDGDGASNGAELDDPDCVWTTADGPLATNAFRPGDAMSTPTTEDESSDGDPAEPKAEEESDDGGCAATPVPAWAALLAAIALRRRYHARSSADLT